VTLDILYDNDRVVDDQADGQDDREQRQQIQREPECLLDSCHAADRRHDHTAQINRILKTTPEFLHSFQITFPTGVSGPGAIARNSIGIVLVGGMMIGTLFTLFVVPSLDVLIARDPSRDRERLGRATL